MRDGRFDNAGLLDGTRGRYGGGGGGEASVRGGSVGGVSDVSSGSGGGAHGNNSGNVARGLLFEVREFYGPCRIEVELVSGGGGGGGGGLGSGGPGSSGGTVLGRCEARLAEALIGRGGSGSSASAGLTKDLPLAYACGAVSKGEGGKSVDWIS